MEIQAVETQAPSSPAPVEASRGAVVNMTPEQRTDWRKTGELPTSAKQDPPNNEESATSKDEQPPVDGTPEGEEKPAAEAKKPQESKRRPDAEARIKQLTDRIKELEAVHTPAKVDAPKPVEQKQPEAQPTRPKPTAEDKDGDKPKYETYEDFVEDLADWKAEQREAKNQREAQQTAQQREFKAKVDGAKERYGDTFEEVLAPAVTAILGDQSVSGVVKTMLNESEVLPDLMFTIGSDAKELASFLKMAKDEPGKALRYIALTESLIREELDGAAKPAADAPVTPKTQAPKPPAEVGGRAASPGDALAEAAKANNFRQFSAEATRRQLAKMKG